MKSSKAKCIHVECVWEESEGQFSVVHKMWKLVCSRCTNIWRVSSRLTMNIFLFKM